MTRVAHVVVIFAMVAGVIIGLAATIYLFAWGIDHFKEGRIFAGLVYMLVWSELGGLAAGLSLILPASLCLSWLERHSRHRAA